MPGPVSQAPLASIFRLREAALVTRDLPHRDLYRYLRVHGPSSKKKNPFKFKVQCILPSDSDSELERHPRLHHKGATFIARG